MAHLSEGTNRLELITKQESSSPDLAAAEKGDPAVHLLWFPPYRDDADAAACEDIFRNLADSFLGTHKDSVVCLLTTPSDAARVVPYLKGIRFQSWISVKLAQREAEISVMKEQHAVLLVLTQYDRTLEHVPTRLGYTYCPYCGKTTKDYGGKKHLYHSYGTLMSDVWRDITCDPATDISPLVDRLQDFFGLTPYSKLVCYDLREWKLPMPAINIDEVSVASEIQSSRVPGNILYNGDSLELLRNFPSDSIDFGFCDPPYNIQKNYDRWDDALEIEEYFSWCDQWLAEMARVLKRGRTLAVLNIPLWAVRHYQFLASQLNFQQWIAWDALSLPVRKLMPANYAIVCFSKGKPRHLRFDQDYRMKEFNSYVSPAKEFACLRQICVDSRGRTPSTRSEPGDLWHDIHRLKHNSRRVDHPCQLPPLLMRRLYSLFTEKGELVLDPFNGAGTSTLVAEQMGREYIGIELSKEYHDLAMRRHEEIKDGKDPFGKQNVIPTAKNSRVPRLAQQQYVVSKKVLQLDIRRIAKELGHLPKREEVISRSPYPIDYFDNYFTGWGEVCAAARTTGMSELPTNREDLFSLQASVA